jgi:PLD-like domain
MKVSCPVLRGRGELKGPPATRLIDGDTILTGSFNFTKAPEQENAENLLTIRDAALAEQYTANW